MRTGTTRAATLLFTSSLLAALAGLATLACSSSSSPANGGSDTGLAPLDAADQPDSARPRTIRTLALGAHHACVETEAVPYSQIICWGRNDHGQIGDGTTSDRSTPTVVTALPPTVVGLQVGGSANCVFAKGGAIDCWGSNAYGQMLDGKTADWLTPQAVSSLNSWVPVPGDHFCGPTGSGAVKCWGRNDFGQLGYATTGTCPDGKACGRTPTDVPGIPFTTGNDVGTIFVGRAHTCTHSAPYTIGSFDAGAEANVINPDVQCWGANDKGQLGDGTTTSRSTPTKALGDVVWLVGNGDSQCAGKATGEILCWGANEYGQLGDGTTTNRPTPTPMPNLAGKGVGAIGTRHACTAGPAGVQCWGANESGQLGYATTETCSGAPCSTTPQPVPGTKGVDRIAVGEAHTCGLRTADSSVVCWGANDHGQLGDGTTTPRPSPTPVALP